MNLEVKEHYQIQFSRHDSKYNRLWNQLASLGIFFVGTIILLALRFLDNLETSNILGMQITIAIIWLIAIFCAICGFVLTNEMDLVKADLEGILKIFEESAFKKDVLCQTTFK